MSEPPLDRESASAAGQDGVAGQDGDSGLPRDEPALEEAIADEADADEAPAEAADEAQDYFSGLKADHRYRLDVY